MSAAPYPAAQQRLSAAALRLIPQGEVLAAFNGSAAQNLAMLERRSAVMGMLMASVAADSGTFAMLMLCSPHAVASARSAPGATDRHFRDRKRPSPR